MSGQQKILDRDGFTKRFCYRDVALPDGAAVRIRALPASYVVDGADDRFSPVKLLVNSLCDENGVLLFADHEVDALMTVDSASLNTVLDAVLELNGCTRPADADDEAGPAEKN